MPDPHEAQQPEALGKTFGDAAAEDEELADEIAQQEGTGPDAQQRFERESAKQTVTGAHPPADADDRQ
jgi:hypothetical protein